MSPLAVKAVLILVVSAESSTAALVLVSGAITGMPSALLQPDKAAGNAKIVSVARNAKRLVGVIMIFQYKVREFQSMYRILIFAMIYLCSPAHIGAKQIGAVFSWCGRQLMQCGIANG